MPAHYLLCECIEAHLIISGLSHDLSAVICTLSPPNRMLFWVCGSRPHVPKRLEVIRHFSGKCLPE